jgi:16S rRNA (cytosine1402-N4)-methyltransferase
VQHTPVLLAEFNQYLPEHCALLIDATLGLGGHARSFLEMSAGGRVFGIDRDQEVLAEARQRLEEFGERVETAHASFDQIAEVAPADADAVFFDFGVSSVQLDSAERGFSFRNSAPLDMRMDRSCGETAADLIARLSERELADLIFELGDERASRRIAKAIVDQRRRGRIETTDELATIVRTAAGGRGKIDAATRTFQALRMAVNDELGQIGRALDGAAKVLRPGGRLIAISFHSGEDRLVKHTLRADERFDVLTKKVVMPSSEERRRNPRSRSAKLRVAERRSACA